MKDFIRGASIWFLLLSVGICCVRSSQACSCSPPSDPQTALRNATAVFTGRVFQVRRLGEYEKGVLFRVYDGWKGMKDRMAEVATLADGATCGVDFREGDYYIVYAMAVTASEGKGHPALQTHLCTRTKPVPLAREEYAGLGKPDISYGFIPRVGLTDTPPLPTGGEKPVKVTGLQAKLAGRWESLDAHQQQLEIAPGTQKSGMAYFWDAKGEYTALEYKITGQDRMRWRTASSIQITIQRQKDQMTWKMEDKRGIKSTVVRTFKWIEPPIEKSA